MTDVAEQHTKAGKTKRTTRRGIKVAAVAGGLVLIGSAAFAYWTQSGTGTGSASTGTTAAITVNQTTTINGLAPGVAPLTLSGDFTNPNTATVHVATVAVTVTSVTKAAGAPAGPCTAADYEILGSPMTVNADVVSGTHVGSWTGATIAFKNDPAASQDGCKGATVTLGYTSS